MILVIKCLKNLINYIRSWSPWSRRILYPLNFRNKHSLNLIWILFKLHQKRKLVLPLFMLQNGRLVDLSFRLVDWSSDYSTNNFYKSTNCNILLLSVCLVDCIFWQSIPPSQPRSWASYGNIHKSYNQNQIYNLYLRNVIFN